MNVNVVLSCFNPQWENKVHELIGFGQTLGSREKGKAPFAQGFLIGHPSFDWRSAMKRRIADQIVLLYFTAYSPEQVLNTLIPLFHTQDLYVFSGDFAGTELAVRSAARKGGSSITGVRALSFEGGLPLVRKRLYSNYVEGRFLMKKPPFCITLASGLFEDTEHEKSGAYTGSNSDPRIINRTDETQSQILDRTLIPLPSKSGLAEAKLLVALGYGAGSKEGVDELAETAGILGGELGVSRPVVMHGWAPPDRLLGVSGMMTRPDMCIAAGVSGSQAFYGAIEKSGFIAAINTDKDAPIMKMADVALVADCREAFALLRRLHQGTEKQ